MFNLLLEKYQKQTKKNLKLQDELDFMKAKEFTNRFKQQMQVLEERISDLTVKNEGLRSQAKDDQKEIYKHKQENQNQLVIIDELR
jgi:uncharacterized protein (UPF0147 family)